MNNHLLQKPRDGWRDEHLGRMHFLFLSLLDLAWWLVMGSSLQLYQVHFFMHPWGLLFTCQSSSVFHLQTQMLLDIIDACIINRLAAEWDTLCTSSKWKVNRLNTISSVPHSGWDYRGNKIQSLPLNTVHLYSIMTSYFSCFWKF